MPIIAAIAVPHPPIILPQVGKGEEARIQKTTEAYRAASAFIADAKPQCIVIVSPHADLYADAFHLSSGPGAEGDFAAYGAPGTQVHAPYDEAYAADIAHLAKKMNIPVAYGPARHPGLDHATAIPLWFLQSYGLNVPIVRIGVSGLSPEMHYHLGECIAQASGERRVAFIASGDLSHRLKKDGPYGFAPEGPQLDLLITSALGSGGFGELLTIDPALAEHGAECGLRAFIIMAGALDGRSVQAKLLSYQDTFGVGYAVATFLPGSIDKERHFLLKHQPHNGGGMQDSDDPYVQLARLTVDSWVRHGRKAPLPKNLPQSMLETRAGVFVSLHEGNSLRGCIGTIGPTTPSIAEEIVQNAVSAATQDPRFLPVEPGELDDLVISVDVLGPAEPVASMDDLDVVRYGVIVSSGGRRGLLLPALEGVDTVADQVDIARRKAGIPAGAPLTLERFEVVRHE